MAIAIVPPDVNRCSGDFTVEANCILFGLAAIKGCGMQAAEAIAAERRARGPFRDLFDFCERLDPAVVNRTAIESLIKAGAFDGTGARRAQNFGAVERALQSGAAALADRRSGQRGLFEDAAGAEPAAATSGTLPNVPEWGKRERLAAEKEVLGFYLTSHPLAEVEETLQTFCTHNTTEAATLSHRSEVLLGGMLASIKFSHTKNPRPGATATKYAMFDLEDTAGLMRCILWPEEFATYGAQVQPDAIVAIRGAIDKRPGSEDANLIVNEIIPLAELPARFTRGVSIRVDEATHGIRGLEQLYEILRGDEGKCAVELVLRLADGSVVTCACERPRVDLTPELRRRVEELLGPQSLRPIQSRPKPTSNGQNGHNGNGHNGYARSAAAGRR